MLVGSRSKDLSSLLPQDDSIASSVFAGSSCVDASSPTPDDSVMCCEYAGNQFVDTSFPTFPDDTIRSQLFTGNQSINTKLSVFQDDSINSWLCADSQFDYVSLPLLAMAPRLWTKTFLATNLITLASPHPVMALNL